jgi:nicotinamidase-related amidase
MPLIERSSAMPITAPLLIVDIQNGFVNDKSRHIVRVVRALASRWLECGAPVYMSQFTNEANSQWDRLLDWHRLTSESEIAIFPGLADISEHAKTYRKQSYSCVVGPFLEDLEREPWTEVVVCGIATDGCVLATVIDLFEYAGRAIRPIVVQDACASHAGAEVHDAGLLLIGRFIGRDQIVLSKEFLTEDGSMLMAR